MSALDDVVNVTIQTETAGTPRAGFGTPLILSPHQLFSDRVRSYSDLAGMVTDGFTTSSPEYKAAAAMFAQTPKPATIKIGKLLNRPVQQFEITPTAANSTAYKLKINGTEVTFTSDASATVAEITAGLKAAIDALAVSGLTTTDVGPGTLLRLTMSTGSFVSVEVDAATMSSLLAIVQNHADPGAAADLDAINLADPDWYGIVNLFNSKLMIEAIAGWAESNERLFIAQTQDSPIVNTASSGTDDVAEALASASRFRTALIYHTKTDAFADAAWAGKLLPKDPGSEKWGLENLSGVTAVALTATQKANARAKKVTTYYAIGGTARTDNKGGKVSSGEWIDVVRTRDAVASDVQVDVLNVLTKGDKVPYTQRGIAAVGAAIEGVLQEYVASGALAADPAPKVTLPAVADISTADKNARNLTGVKFDAVLAGAIVIVDPIKGTLSV